MKHIKKILLWIISLSVLISSLGIAVFAEEKFDTPYEEDRWQINFDDLEVAVCSSGQMVLSVDESRGWLSRRQAKRELEKAKAFLGEYSEIEKQLAQSMLECEGNLRAVGCTVAPLVEVNGHYERVKKENKLLDLLLAPFMIHVSANTKTGDSERTKESDYFVMYTTIWDKYSMSGHDYTARTYAHWTKNSALSGSQYPAGGDDYILLAVPQAMVMVGDRCQAKYRTAGYGSAQDDYSRVSGGKNWVQYSIVDDPFGPRQLTEVALDGYCDGDFSIATRKINSYYVHTWKQLSLSISVDAELSGTGLSITPSIEDKSWSLYSYVTFNF